jgi:beta-N-acetylhexosaminidase
MSRDDLSILHARIGRVLMVAPPDGWTRSTAWLDDLQPAGVILFKRNLPDDVEEARAGIARMQAWASARGDTLLVAMDEEGGFVTQTSAYWPTPPSARALAWAGGPETTRAVYARYGARLRHFGVNTDFAPVCDVNNNPRNPVIGARSFGDDAETVGAYARAVHAGLMQAGVLSCAKHFPGHGDTDLDSHLALPVIAHARERFDRVELPPFRALLHEVPLVMVAHVACPKIGDGELPATLSPRIATDLLRIELGFGGVAVTDAMDMEGVSGHFGWEEAAVRAMLAGCDLLLYCFELDRPERARAGLVEAVQSGRLPLGRLAQATERVDRLRALAAARGDAPGATDALPDAEEDAAFYRETCAATIRVGAGDPWAVIGTAVRAGKPVTLAGWHADALAALAARLRERGVDAGTRAPDAINDAGALVVVLAERKPLAPPAIETLAQIARAYPHAVLANLGTPEVDASVAQWFDTRLRTADWSACMLDVLSQRWCVGLG